MRSEPIKPILLGVFAFSAGEAIFRAEQSLNGSRFPLISNVEIRPQRVMFVRELFVDEINDHELRYNVLSDEVDVVRTTYRNQNGMHTRCREYVVSIGEDRVQ